MIKRLLARVRKDEKGLETLEIAVIAVILVIIALAGWQFLGRKIEGSLRTIGNQIDQAGQTQPTLQ